ncbi:MAG: nucleotidyltransferase family protein [Clostridiales bacterium]|nr:nucleotidyltransferase family protein [Clostridiales bacterium]
MKTAGIIAEYNPFHNGHQFHIEETRRRTGADYIIAVLSGDFVQRGAPALLSKYVRAEMTLRHGADLVIELPVTAALSSAEGFATGGVRLLDKLNVIDVVSCGCENASEDTALFQEIVCLLADEPEEYRTLLRTHIKSGTAFPAARELAFSQYLQSTHPESSEMPDKTEKVSCPGTSITTQSGLKDKISRLLSSPNNILAIEYAKAIHTLSDSMKLCLIPRKGGAYHSAALSEGFSSATAIRRCLLEACDCRYTSGHAAGNPNRPEKVSPDTSILRGQIGRLRGQVPPLVFDNLQQAAAQRQCLNENNFSDLLFYSLIQRADCLNDYCPAGSDLACRIRNSMEAFTDWQEFALLIKSKNRTYTAVSRCLAHILLDLTEDDFAISAEYGHAPYVRVLGFRRDAALLLKAIQAQADIPLLMHPAKDFSRLDEKQARLFKKNVQASEIYKHILYQQSGFRMKSEFRQPLIIL